MRNFLWIILLVFGIHVSTKGQDDLRSLYEGKTIEQLLVLQKQVDEKVQSYIFCLLCDKYRSIGNFEESIRYGKLGYDLGVKLKYNLRIIAASTDLGNTYLDKGDFKQASYYFQKSLDYSLDVPTHQIKRSSIYNNLGNAYSGMGDYDLALKNYHESIKIDRSLGDSLSLMKTTANVGSIYYMKGNRDIALNHFLNALKISRDLKDFNFESSILSKIGEIFLEKKDPDKAAEYFKLATVINEKTKDLSGICLSNLKLTDIYIQKQQIDSAQICAQRALEISLGSKQKINESHALYLLGNVYRAKNKYNQALEYFLKSLYISENNGSQEKIISAAQGISEIYFLKNDFNRSNEYARKSFAVANEMENIQSKMQSALLIYKSDSALGNFKSALEFYHIYNSINRSLYDKSKSKQIIKIESDQKLKSQRIIFEKEKKEQKDRIIFLTLIALSLAGIAVLFYWLFRTKQRTNKLLDLQNKQIQVVNQNLQDSNEAIQTQSLKIQHQNEKLKSLTEFKESMVSMLIHDLKNPLNSILFLSKEGNKDFQAIHSSANQMKNLILNVLDIQKYEATSITILPGVWDVNIFINIVLQQVELIRDSKQIIIENRIPKNEVTFLDYGLMERTMVNFLTNALKFTPPYGTIRLSVISHRINSKEEKSKNIEQIWWIEDSGPGIPKEKVDLVFEKFGQTQEVSFGQMRSTGLGLTFCKWVVEAHGGKIAIKKSRQLLGAKFEFNFLFTAEELDISDLTNNNPTVISPFDSSQIEVKIDKEILESDIQNNSRLQTITGELELLDYYELSEILPFLKEINQMVKDSQVDTSWLAWTNQIHKAALNSDEIKFKEKLSELSPEKMI